MPDSPDRIARQGNDARAQARALTLGGLAITLCFLPGLWKGTFFWDDIELISTNQLLRSWGRLPSLLLQPFWTISSDEVHSPIAYYRPWITLIHELELHAFGLHPGLYRAVNLALHLGCSALAFRWVRRSISRFSLEPKKLTWVAAIVTLAFALHPTRPESVTFICGDSDLWMTLWGLLGVDLFESSPEGSGLGAGMCFALAAASKEVGLCFPALLLIDVSGASSPLRRRKVAAFLLESVMLLGLRGVLSPPHISLLGATPDHALGRVLSSFGLFAREILWPSPASLFPGEAPLQPGWREGIFAAALLSTEVLTIAGSAHHPSARAAGAAVLWFLLPLVPVLNVVPLNLEGVVADRYLYLPMIGLAGLSAHAACLILERWGAAAWSLMAAGVLGGLLLVPATVARVLELRTGESAWRHEIQVHPNSIGSYRNLANALLDEHRKSEALVVRRQAIDRAQNEGDRLETCVAWVDDLMGTVSDGDEPTLTQISKFYGDVGDPTQPRIAVDIADLHEELAPPPRTRQQLRSTSRFRNNAAVAHARAMNFARAEVELVALSESQPNRGVLYNLGRAQALQGEWDRARASFEHAHALDPSADAQSPWPQWIERGIAAARIADPVERTIAQAQLFISLGSPRAALAAIDKARRITPGNEQLVQTQVHLDARLGRWDEAGSVLAEAGRASPEPGERWKVLTDWVEQHAQGSGGKPPDSERRQETPLPAPP